jgi:hypothetical protein
MTVSRGRWQLVPSWVELILFRALARGLGAEPVGEGDVRHIANAVLRYM